MAAPDLEKLVRIVFSGDASDLTQTISGVESGFNTLGASLENATEPFAKVFDNVVKIDAALAALAIGGMAVVITKAGEFNDSFLEITTLLSGSNDEIEEFRDDLLDYAAGSTVAFDQITDATYQIISAMGEEVDAIGILTQAEQLNVAGKGELGDTTKLLVTSLNAYGDGVNEAADYSDILFTTVKTGVTNLTELSSSLGQITGLASAADVPFSDLNTAVGALTGTVGDTSLSITMLKGILTAILGPGTAAQKMADDLHIAFNAEALAAEGLHGFLQKVYDATDGNQEKMKVLFGRVEAFTGALILGADKSGKYASALEKMENRSGATAIAFEKMSDKLENSNQKIINSFQALLIVIGGPFLDEWADIAEAFASVFSGIKIAFDEGAFDELTEYIESMMSEIAQDFTTLAENLPEALEGVDWSGFIDALDELVQAVSGVTGAIFDFDINDAESLKDAIQSVIDAFEQWIQFTTGIVEGIGPFIAKIADLADQFLDLDGDTLKSAGQLTSWGKIINEVAGFVPNLTAPLNLLTGAVSLLALTNIPSAIAAFSSFGGAATALLSTAITPLAAGATALAGGWYIGSKIGEDIPILGEAGIAMGNLMYAIANLGDSTVESMEAQAAHTQELAAAAIEMVNTKEAAGELASQIEEIPIVTIETNFESVQDDFEGINSEIDQLIDSGDIEVNVDADMDTEKFYNDWDEIVVIAEDGTEIPIKLESEKAVDDAKKADDKIDKELTDKQIEIKLQGEIDIELAQIKAQAETLQTAFEWDAKVKIANIEAEVEEVKALSDLLSAAWESTGEVIASAFGVLANVSPGSPAFHVIEAALEKELKIRQQIADSTIALNDAQIALLKARADALKSGDALIKIDTSGVEPALEQVLYSIVQKAQIKANEEGFSALLGI